MGTEYQPEVQRLPETGTSPLSFHHEFTTPKKVLYAGSGRQFSMAGPAALPSPQLTGKSETKYVVHAGERPGLA